jgi:hypothetical protein
MKVDTARIYEGERLWIEIDGFHFDSDDYPSTKDTIQALINYVEGGMEKGVKLKRFTQTKGATV